MKYLQELKNRKALLHPLQKLQKAPSYSFCSSESVHFEKTHSTGKPEKDIHQIPSVVNPDLQEKERMATEPVKVTTFGPPSEPLVKCGECHFFDRWWCVRKEGSWDRKRGQESDLLHRCEWFTVKHERKDR